MGCMISGFCHCTNEICIDVIMEVNIRIQSYRYDALHCVKIHTCVSQEPTVSIFRRKETLSWLRTPNFHVTAAQSSFNPTLPCNSMHLTFMFTSKSIIAKLTTQFRHEVFSFCFIKILNKVQKNCRF
jgi:hypothetical protein